MLTMPATVTTVGPAVSAYYATSVRVVLGRKEHNATVKTVRLDTRAYYATSLRAELGRKESDTCFK